MVQRGQETLPRAAPAFVERKPLCATIERLAAVSTSMPNSTHNVQDRRDGTAQSTVLAAKLGPLVQRAGEVRRKHLAQRLAEAGAARLVVVRAPAGFGKTTAMVQLRDLLEDRGVSSAWLTLDRADNDVSRFLANLAAAIDPLEIEHRPGVPAGPLELLASATSPVAVFLDDFELIREGGVNGLVREMIEHLPRDGLLVIGSRSMPDVGMGRLRMRGQLLELNAEHLRFSPSEAAEFFRLRGAELSTEAVEQACERTEGWVAALWLLSLALQRNGHRSEFVQRLSVSERDVADYLTEEVLALQDPGARSFLLRTSILRHLSAPVCGALLPELDCAAILSELERSNVFLTPIEGNPDLYRYHSLFANFLRAQLSREAPQEISRLHLAASRWYESQDRPVPAIDHSIEGGDLPHALDLLQQHAEVLLDQGRIRLLDRWFTVITWERLRGRPLLQVVAVWARCMTQGPWQAMQWLQESGCQDSADAAVQAHVRAVLPVLLAMMDRYADAHRVALAGLACVPSGHAFTDSLLLNVMAHIVSVAGDRDQAHRFLEDARRARGNSAFNRMYTETVEGLLDLRGGRLRQATARFRMAVTSGPQAAGYSYLHGDAWSGVLYASVVYEANDIATTERMLNVYLPLARDVGLPDHMITSYRIRARIEFERGDVDAAFQTLIELEYLGHERKLPRVSANAKLERARILLLQGNGAAAREELSRADDGLWELVQRDQRAAQDVEDLFIGRQRLALHVGNARSTLRPLENELACAVAGERRQRALKLRLLLALALYRTDDVARANDELTIVLGEASREGFVRLILDEGPAVAPLVRRLMASLQARSGALDPIFGDYLLRLADALHADLSEDEPLKPPVSLTEPLTRKEIRILQLLAEGYSNTAMAEKLFVSESTVRTHLRNISSKLNSRNRTQAVTIARQLGVIS